MTPKQLETLLNGLLAYGQEERLPYCFFVEEQQLAEELGAHLLRHKAREQSLSRCPKRCGIARHFRRPNQPIAPASLIRASNTCCVLQCVHQSQRVMVQCS